MLQIIAAILIAYVVIVTFPAVLFILLAVVALWIVAAALFALGHAFIGLFENKKTPAEDK